MTLRMRNLLAGLALAGTAGLALAAGPDIGGATKQPTNWHAIVMLTWLSLVAFAWLLAEIIVDACRRHARNRAIASIDDDADMNNGHDAAAGSRRDIGKDGKACIGSGHVIVATCVVVSAALSLALLAFWGLFC